MTDRDATPSGNGASSGNDRTASNGAAAAEAPTDTTSTGGTEVRNPQRGAITGRWGTTAGMPAEKSKDFGGTVRRLLRQMAAQRTQMIIVVTTAIGSVVFTVIGPKVLAHATDIVVRGVFIHHGVDFPALRHTLLVAVGLYVAATVLRYWQSYALADVVQKAMHRLRSDVEDKIHHLPLRYVDGRPRGDLLSRVTNDIDNLAQSLQQSLAQMLTSVLMIIGVGVMMFTIDPILAGVAIVTIPLSIVIVRIVTQRSKRWFIAQWRDTGELNSQVEESFTGHALVKVFGQQGAALARFQTTNDRLYEASFRAQFITGVIQPAMMFLGNLNFVAIAVVGGLLISSGRMTVGDIQAFIQYSRAFTQPITQMASMANVLQSGIASAERVFELLDAEDESPDPEHPLVDERPEGRVEFERVKFSYRADQELIRDLSLVAEPGETVAIVGPTGAGKTTLVNLIMRFYEVDGGRITLDGVDIAQMTRAELRSNIGMVLQDTWLFGGTIRENIAYGNLDATEEQIRAAAKAAYVDRFVHSLPDGYDTRLDDDGTTVSAGEKQLITIARAFLADPTILILDEATSSVDTRTEVLIQQAMSALRSSRTSFVIAHRLSTIRDADLILVMENGSIVEQGTHEELVARGGAYYQLYNAQFAGPAIEELDEPAGTPST
ncbi:MAG TPA: ABC transporter ATP-binding protein [Acidimicrobiales bacterium]|nr:ABC transporter ATP-binding protein [Acidimicrobiales bacterium]